MQLRLAQRWLAPANGFSNRPSSRASLPAATTTRSCRADRCQAARDKDDITTPQSHMRGAIQSGESKSRGACHLHLRVAVVDLDPVPLADLHDVRPHLQRRRALRMLLFRLLTRCAPKIGFRLEF